MAGRREAGDDHVGEPVDQLVGRGARGERDRSPVDGLEVAGVDDGREVDQRRAVGSVGGPSDVRAAVGRRCRRVVRRDDPGDALTSRPASRRIDQAQQGRAGHQLERGVQHERVGRIATGHGQVTGGELHEPAVADLVEPPIGPSVDDVTGVEVSEGVGAIGEGPRGHEDDGTSSSSLEVKGVRARLPGDETVGGEWTGEVG